MLRHDADIPTTLHRNGMTQVTEFVPLTFWYMSLEVH